jgi:hypothetical protein
MLYVILALAPSGAALLVSFTFLFAIAVGGREASWCLYCGGWY